MPSSQPAKRRVALLGATGSIGESALRVISAHSDRLELVGIASQKNHRRLAEIARQFGVRHVAIHDASALAEVRATGSGFPAGTEIVGGDDGLQRIATLPEADIVLVAVVGTTALAPTLAAIAARKDIALASKEILVLAGRFVIEAARASASQLLPVDSEHNAVFQCLEGHRAADVRRVILTASGGAFRDWPLEKLTSATPADALKHPNWSMGPKVTVDAATMANKGLELIEAQWLFGLRPEQCEAILHAQSKVHCLVEFSDGSMLTQLGPPSMTFPIQHALLWPQRAAKPTDSPMSLASGFSLDFKPVDFNRYPMLELAHAVMRTGGAAPAIYNAANEIAVAAFLAGRVPFLAIHRIVEQTLSSMQAVDSQSLSQVLAADAEARRIAMGLTTARTAGV